MEELAVAVLLSAVEASRHGDKWAGYWLRSELSREWFEFAGITPELALAQIQPSKLNAKTKVAIPSEYLPAYCNSEERDI